MTKTLINPPFEDNTAMAQTMVLYLKDCDLDKDKYPGDKFPTIYSAMGLTFDGTVLSNLILIENPKDWIPDHITEKHGDVNAVLVSRLDGMPPPDREKWDERIRPFIEEKFGLDAILIPHIPDKEWPETTIVVIWIPIMSEFDKFKLILSHIIPTIFPKAINLIHPKLVNFKMTKKRREHAARKLTILQKNIDAVLAFGLHPTLKFEDKITVSANGLVITDVGDCQFYSDSPLLELLKD